MIIVQPRAAARPINEFMGFDPLVSNPGRLSILAALAGQGRRAVEFVRLRATTRLTDGNLAAHAKRLRAGGLIRVDKEFEAGKPVTRFTLTLEGRQALEAHVRRIEAVIREAGEEAHLVGGAAESETVALGADDPEDDWVD